MDAHLDQDVAMRVQSLVDAGAFRDVDSAVNELVRAALAGARRERPYPSEPLPPPVRNPGDDTPISVNPSDVNWAP